jgi:hypothetical protein
MTRETESTAHISFFFGSGGTIVSFLQLACVLETISRIHGWIEEKWRELNLLLVKFE